MIFFLQKFIIWFEFYREQCFCGNNYGKYGKVDDKECKMVCTYDKTTKCGGSHRNSVYTLLK